MSGDGFRDVRPKWVNPCGGVLEDVSIDPDAPPLTDAEIAANTILEVDLALNQIRSFRDEFVSGKVSSSRSRVPMLARSECARQLTSLISWDGDAEKSEGRKGHDRAKQDHFVPVQTGFNRWKTRSFLCFPQKRRTYSQFPTDEPGHRRRNVICAFGPSIRARRCLSKACFGCRIRQIPLSASQWRASVADIRKTG